VPPAWTFTGVLSVLWLWLTAFARQVRMDMPKMRRNKTAVRVFLAAMALVDLVFIYDAYSGRCGAFNFVLAGMLNGLCYALLYVSFPIVTPARAAPAPPVEEKTPVPWWLVAVVGGLVVAGEVVAAQNPKKKR
jgi:hypothetical protein